MRSVGHVHKSRERGGGRLALALGYERERLKRAWRRPGLKGREPEHGGVDMADRRAGRNLLRAQRVARPDRPECIARALRGTWPVVGQNAQEQSIGLVPVPDAR